MKVGHALQENIVSRVWTQDSRGFGVWLQAICTSLEVLHTCAVI